MVMACCTALESHKAKPPSVAAVSKLTKYTIENTVGSPFVPRAFSSFSGPLAFLTRAGVLAARVLTGQLSINSGFGLANTSLAFLGNRLLALYEGDRS